MGSIKHINHNGEVVAVIIRKDYKPPKSRFITPEKSIQEVGFFKYKKNHIVEPHIHPLHKRVIFGTPETVYIRSGKVKYSFYSSAGEFIESEILTKGDIVILISSGHGQKFLEETTVVVVKQGPYLGEKDKTFIKKDL